MFDPRRLPDDQNLLVSYGDDEIEKRLSHYGKDLQSLVTDKVLAEWASFKEIMFEPCRLFQSSVDKKIAKETDQNAISQLIKQQKEYTPVAFFDEVSNNQLCYDLDPGCMYFSNLSLSVAYVERLFSKISGKFCL